MKRILTFLCIVLCSLTFAATSFAQNVVLTFTGDVTLGNSENLMDKPYSFTAFSEKYGADYFLRNFASLFSADDATIINLEGALTNSPARENKEKAHRFRGATNLVDVLTGSSVEIANIANNHSHDYGKQGFESTLATLDNAGIGYFGERYTYIFQKDSIKIAFFGARNIDYIQSVEWCKSEFTRLKDEEGVNAIVFVFHSGAEYDLHRTESQERFARQVIRAGADLVIMHHPHVAQGIDIYNNRTICYSLGNFCFGGNNKVLAMEAAVAQVTMDFDESGKYTGQQVNLIPVAISGTYPESNYQPCPATEEQAKSLFATIQNDTEFALPPYDTEKAMMSLPYLPAE